MDLAMPGLDGYETTRRMKADPLTQNTVVCAVTALAMPSDQQSARDAGCEAVFIKPIDVRLLAAEIQRLAGGLDRSRAS
jgi:two-component system, cell cycle response regulator DivK